MKKTVMILATIVCFWIGADAQSSADTQNKSKIPVQQNGYESKKELLLGAQKFLRNFSSLTQDDFVSFFDPVTNISAISAIFGSDEKSQYENQQAYIKMITDDHTRLTIAAEQAGKSWKSVSLGVSEKPMTEMKDGVAFYRQRYVIFSDINEACTMDLMYCIDRGKFYICRFYKVFKCNDNL
ncbi:MAG: hypothetical protein LBP85_06130 [Prevotellaceae bacterium]|jgi:hypothetical protein|nr:hypothetical protein [Prevotellaceae bacterium]